MALFKSTNLNDNASNYFYLILTNVINFNSNPNRINMIRSSDSEQMSMPRLFLHPFRKKRDFSIGMKKFKLWMNQWKGDEKLLFLQKYWLGTHIKFGTRIVFCSFSYLLYLAHCIISLICIVWFVYQIYNIIIKCDTTRVALQFQWTDWEENSISFETFS